MDIFLNYRVKFCLNNMANLHPLAPHIMPSYTHKMAIRIVSIDSVTSFHSMYRVLLEPGDLRLARVGCDRERCSKLVRK